tara:strand:- start:19 stop:171 length:153 start_codon:yes stop_codon:yes gene_type:complete
MKKAFFLFAALAICGFKANEFVDSTVDQMSRGVLQSALERQQMIERYVRN